MHRDHKINHACTYNKDKTTTRLEVCQPVAFKDLRTPLEHFFSKFMVHPAKEWPRTVVHNVMIADSRSILYRSYLEGILSAIRSHCSRMYLECKASLSISLEWSLSGDWALTLDTCKWLSTTISTASINSIEITT